MRRPTFQLNTRFVASTFLLGSIGGIVPTRLLVAIILLITSSLILALAIRAVHRRNKPVSLFKSTQL